MNTKPIKSFTFYLRGQSMVEYTVVLVFGVMLLTTGPAGDVIQDLVDVMKDNYRGYSYTVSLSTPPDHDSILEYLNDPDVDSPINPNDIVNQIGNYTQFPTLGSFPSNIPTSPNDFISGIGTWP